jgi:hypothetical protein
MAMEAIQLARFRARIHEPPDVGVILAPVPSVGMEVRIFEQDQVIVIEETVSRTEGIGEGTDLPVAWRARLAFLLGAQGLPAD